MVISARINPLSLQELCRFKIRKTIRETIEAESPDYYVIKRQKSNFNTMKKLGNNKEATSAYSSYLNDSQEENESDPDETDRPNYPITRFERIFSPSSNVDFNSNDFEHQIRLMIYGHLLDAANNSLQLAVNATNDFESDTDNDQDSNNEVANISESNNDGSDQESSGGSFKSFLHDFSLSAQKNDPMESEESDAASEADLFELFAENCRKVRSSGNLLGLFVSKDDFKMINYF